MEPLPEVLTSTTPSPSSSPLSTSSNGSNSVNNSGTITGKKRRINHFDRLELDKHNFSWLDQFEEKKLKTLNQNYVPDNKLVTNVSKNNTYHHHPRRIAAIEAKKELVKQNKLGTRGINSSEDDDGEIKMPVHNFPTRAAALAAKNEFNKIKNNIAEDNEDNEDDNDNQLNEKENKENQTDNNNNTTTTTTDNTDNNIDNTVNTDNIKNGDKEDTTDKKNINLEEDKEDSKKETSPSKQQSQEKLDIKKMDKETSSSSSSSSPTPTPTPLSSKQLKQQEKLEIKKKEISSPTLSSSKQQKEKEKEKTEIKKKEIPSPPSLKQQKQQKPEKKVEYINIKCEIFNTSNQLCKEVKVKISNKTKFIKLLESIKTMVGKELTGFTYNNSPLNLEMKPIDIENMIKNENIIIKTKIGNKK